MLVGIVTLKSAPWELEDNFRRLEAYVREAAGRRAQVIVAPESVLDGYVFNADPTSQLADMLEIAQTVPDGSYIQRAGALCKELGIYLIFGLLEREDQTLFNACVMLDPQGEVIAHYRKITTAGEYAITPGRALQPFDTPLGRLGFLLCSDRTVDNCAVLGVQGAQVIFIPMDGSGGPENTEKMRWRARDNSLLDCHCQHLERGNHQPKRGIALGEVRNRMHQRAIRTLAATGQKSRTVALCSTPARFVRASSHRTRRRLLRWGGQTHGRGRSAPTGHTPEGSGGVVKDDIVDIRDRVARHDLRYDAVPFTYFEGFILGNGDLGAVLWFEEDRMVLSLDKADVWERRADQSLEPGMDYRTALQQARDGSFDPSCRVFDPVRPPDRVWGNKLPIGRVEWPLGQTPTALEGKIALYEAAFSLELQLEQGALTVWGYLHACENIVEIEVEAHGRIPLPACSVARRLDERSEEIMKIWDYPETEYGGEGTDRYLVQGYSGDEEYAVFVRQCHVASNRARCAVTVVRGAAGMSCRLGRLMLWRLGRDAMTALTSIWRGGRAFGRARICKCPTPLWNTCGTRRCTSWAATRERISTPSLSWACGTPIRASRLVTATCTTI